MFSQQHIMVKKDPTKVFEKSQSYLYINPQSRSLKSSQYKHEVETIKRNYNSVYFDNEDYNEDYNQQVLEALMVQLQKDMNLENPIIKPQFDKWMDDLKQQFQKKSKCNLIVITVAVVKKTLVFDLDETLVRAQEELPLNGQYDTRIKLIDNNGNQQFVSVSINLQIHIIYRPYL